MKDHSRNQLDAAKITYDYLLLPEHVLIWTPLEAFGEGVLKIEGSLAITHTLLQVQAGKIEGITADKNRLRQSLERRVIILAKAAISFGKAKNDGDLVAQGNALNSKSELKEIADGLLSDSALMLHEKTRAARDADPALAKKYGLKSGPDDTVLAPVLSATNAYGAVVGSPRSATVTKAGAADSIEVEIRRLQDVLRNDLDNLIVQFEDEHGGFVRDYFASRKIIGRGGRGEKSTGDPGTGSPAPAN